MHRVCYAENSPRMTLMAPIDVAEIRLSASIREICVIYGLFLQSWLPWVRWAWLPPGV